MEPQLGQSWLKLDDRRFRWVQVFGRLRPSVSAEQAQSGLQPYFRSVLELEAALPAFTTATAETRRRFTATKVEVRLAAHGISGLRQSVETPLKILMAVAVGVSTGLALQRFNAVVRTIGQDSAPSVLTLR